MSYLNNSVIELDAILTRKGKQLLSQGASNFKITQFALADDEIDYRLWNPNHNLGTNYYGEMIENMPILEALSDETQIMKYKLITLNKNTVRIPKIDIGQTSVTLQNGGQSYTVVPTTINYENGNATYGYTAILSNSDVCILRPTPGYEVNVNNNPTTNTQNLVSSSQSISAIGRRFDIIAKPQYVSDQVATLTIIGNETGGRSFLTILIKKQTSVISTTNNNQTSL
jgi:hypothetical protein